MFTPEMFAAMTGSVLQHAEGHIKTAFELCDAISKDSDSYEQRRKDAQKLITELRVIRDDMKRALMFLDIDALDQGEE